MTYTVAAVAAELGVHPRTITSWILSGQLQAYCVSRRPASKKPRWRIDAEALNQFKVNRSPCPTPPARARARKPASNNIIEFYT